MRFEIYFYDFREKVKHLYPHKRFGILYLRTNDYQKMTLSLFGMKYISSYMDQNDSTFLIFEIINKEKFLWSKLKYGI